VRKEKRFLKITKMKGEELDRSVKESAA